MRDGKTLEEMHEYYVSLEKAPLGKTMRKVFLETYPEYAMLRNTRLFFRYHSTQRIVMPGYKFIQSDILLDMAALHRDTMTLYRNVLATGVAVLHGLTSADFKAALMAHCHNVASVLDVVKATSTNDTCDASIDDLSASISKLLLDGKQSYLFPSYGDATSAVGVATGGKFQEAIREVEAMLEPCLGGTPWNR